MADRKGPNIKREESIYTKEGRAESRDNLVTSQYTSNRTWRKVEDNRVGNKKLLVVRGNERYRKICRRI